MVDLTFIDANNVDYVRQIAWFADHLIAGNVSVNGSAQPNMVYWGYKNHIGIIADPTGYGEEGWYPIGDASGEILRFIRLGAHLVIYFDRSIAICDPTYSASVYNFDVRVTEIGIVGPSAVIDIGGLHIFRGLDDFFLYDGGLRPRPIGRRINKVLKDNMDFSKQHLIKSFHDKQNHRAIFYYPDVNTTDAFPQSFVAYDYQDDTWTKGRMSVPIRSVDLSPKRGGYRFTDFPFREEDFVGTGDGENDPKCNGQITGGNWDTDETSAIRFSDTTITSDTVQNILVGFDGIIYKLLNTDTDDDGTTFEASLTTKDIAVGEVYGGYGEITKIEIEAFGDDCTLEFSIDHGGTWTVVSTTVSGTLDGDGNNIFKTNKFTFFNLVCQFIMLRVTYSEASINSEVRMGALTVKARTDRTVN